VRLLSIPEGNNNDYYLYQRVITMIIIYIRGRRTLVLITKKYTGNNKHVSACHKNNC
jgi:hypothetical protein